MSEDNEQILERLQEMRNAIRGLSIEVEAWRVSTDSHGEFILCALRDWLVSLNRILDEVNDDLH